MSIIDMRSYMGADLSGVFTYDFPDTFTYLGTTYNGLFKDRQLTEIDEFGGPIYTNAIEIHVLASALSSVINGGELIAKGETKLIYNSMLSEDGNELIIYGKTA